MIKLQRLLSEQLGQLWSFLECLTISRQCNITQSLNETLILALWGLNPLYMGIDLSQYNPAGHIILHTIVN